jgi:hypothetical protein
MATKCNSNQQYSAVANIFTMAYALSSTKLLLVFGKDNQTSILNLLPHLKDPTSITGLIMTQTCTPSYITLKT